MLQDGGNAMDSAIATMAVLSVVETLNVGLGGDCFALYAPKGTDKIVAYNGSGRAPNAANPEWYRERRYTEIPPTSPHAVTIPGAVEAWARLSEDHGTLGLDKLLEPAILLAESGYPVHDVIASWWNGDVEKLKADKEATRILLWDGKAPAPGTIHRQPELAATMRAIARNGKKAFYEGAVGEVIARHLRSLGGLHTAEDFSTHTGEYVTPISATYRGHEVYECPPNGQGIAALMMLGILEGFDLASLSPLGADRLHLAIEAGRLAIRDRDRLIGDPHSAEWSTLLEPKYLDGLRSQIQLERAALPTAPSTIPMSRDTCHVAVVDRDRNAVSMIASVFHNFGSGIVVPSTGVVLQNRGHGFVLTPGHPNEIGPRKRPLHTIIPALICRGGMVSHVLGVVGGHYQAWGHAHVITNLIDFGQDIQAAIDLPRVFHNGSNVEVEGGIPDEALAGLVSRKHLVTNLAHTKLGRLARLGGGQLIAIDQVTGTFAGAADPRLDGCALGF